MALRQTGFLRPETIAIATREDDILELNDAGLGPVNGVMLSADVRDCDWRGLRWTHDRLTRELASRQICRHTGGIATRFNTGDLYLRLPPKGSRFLSPADGGCLEDPNDLHEVWYITGAPAGDTLCPAGTPS